MKENNKRVCPVERSNGLDNILRKLIHNPKKILSGYVKEGMTVLDAGCGPGMFSLEIAKMVGDSGKVIAADLQQGMLKKLKDKINGKEIEKRIRLHQCKEDTIGVDEKVDVVLAFYMVHEIPDPDNFLKEIKSILKPNGQIIIVEPKFHVTKKEFETCLDKAATIGLKTIKRPKIFLSRAAVLKN